MIRKLALISLVVMSVVAWSQDVDESLEQSDFLPEYIQQTDEADRGPAAIPSETALKRKYPGGTDEEDLSVRPYLPEAPLTTNTRMVQREVFRSLYNQELKDERADSVEE
jgi:hypothetical protein